SPSRETRSSASGAFPPTSRHLTLDGASFALTRSAALFLPSSVAERQAPDDLRHQDRELVVALRQRRHDGVDGRPVVVLEAAAQSVDHQLLGQVAGEEVLLVLQDLLQLARPLERLVVGQRPTRVYVELAVLRPPLADGVVVLEGEADGV